MTDCDRPACIRNQRLAQYAGGLALLLSVCFLIIAIFCVPAIIWNWVTGAW